MKINKMIASVAFAITLVSGVFIYQISYANQADSSTKVEEVSVEEQSNQLSVVENNDIEGTENTGSIVKTEPVETPDSIIDISNINPEDIHIPLNLDKSNSFAVASEGLTLQYARGFETGSGTKIQANYQLPDGKSQILVSQSLNPGGLDTIDQLKANFDPENLTETEINGHKAIIEEGRVRGQVFIITDTYFYMVGSTDSIDISVLKAVAEQINAK